MNLLLWIIFGALAGWLASIIMHTDYRQGAMGNIILGIIGALAGGFLMQLLGGTGITGFNLYSLFVAVIGSVLVIYLIKVLV